VILIGIGANLPSKYGPPDQTILAAFKALEARGMAVKALSRIWLSAPVPESSQPWYRNAVAAVETDMDAAHVLRLLKQIERSFGRETARKNAARMIDLDVLAYHDLIMDDVDIQIQIPHPRMHERAFVLYPLQEVAPNWRHPLWPDKTLAEWIAALPVSQKIKPLHDSIAI
jgi:2-amino-4-hydroxy-6-hydroxymethyldihydropteridine diphosphokinase